MANSAQLSINNTSWTEVVGSASGLLIHIQGRFAFYIVYSDTSPVTSDGRYLVEDNKDTPTASSEFIGVCLGKAWLLTKDQDQVVTVTVGADSYSPSGTATEGTLQDIETVIGAQADAAASTDTGTFSIVSFVKRSLQNWTTLLARIPALVSGRVPVVADYSRASGAMDANTLRVTLATDGPTVSTLTSIDNKTPAVDNSKQPVIPSMTTGGNVSAQTAATGTNWTAFGSQALKQLTISNQTGVTLEFRQGGSGVGFQIPTGAFYTFFGITNSNQIDVRRVDTSNTQVTVQARWES